MISAKEFKKQMMVIPLQQKPLFKQKEIDALLESGVRFTEEYKRGVHETWGGRAIIVYDTLYRLINNAEKLVR